MDKTVTDLALDVVAPDDAPMLTEQERTLVVSLARGMTLAQAARLAGYTQTTSAKKALERPHVASALGAMRNSLLASLGNAVTRENLTLMLFEAHRNAATATEQIAAIREIGKMHGLYEPERKVVDAHISGAVQHIRQLDDAELVRLAGLSTSDIDIEDADYTEVDDG